LSSSSWTRGTWVGEAGPKERAVLPILRDTLKVKKKLEG
jgi:hypothetical protein